jgi:hypothetical protein
VFPQGGPSFGKWRASLQRLGSRLWLNNSAFVIKPMPSGACDAHHLTCNGKPTVDIPRYGLRVIEAGGGRQQRVNIFGGGAPAHAYSDHARYDNEQAANSG